MKTGTATVRIDNADYERIAMAAAKANRTVAGQLRIIFKRFFRERS